jgi:hypothetical protein
MSADFGEMSAVDTVLLRQACLLLARGERVHSVKDADVGLRMSGEARRLLLTLRRHHVTPPPAEETYAAIAAQAQKEASQRRAQELAEDEDEAIQGNLPDGVPS